MLVGAGAFVSVDTFFFLSGFLAMLSQLEKYSITSAPVRPSQPADLQHTLSSQALLSFVRACCSGV